MKDLTCKHVDSRYSNFGADKHPVNLHPRVNKSCQFNPRDVGEPHNRLDDKVFLQKKSTVMNENLVQFIK